LAGPSLGFASLPSAALRSPSARCARLAADFVGLLAPRVSIRPSRYTGAILGAE